MSDFLKVLMEGGELSDSAKSQIQEAFDNAVKAKSDELVKEKTEELNIEFAKKIDEKTTYLEKLTEQYISEEVVSSVDKYLSAAVAEFMKENKLAVESALKVELAEGFLKGLGGIAKDYSVKLPENSDNVMEEIQSKLDKAEARLAEETAKRVDIEKSITEMKKTKVAESCISELTDTQKEKISEQISKIDYIDDEQYKIAINKIVESYSPVVETKEEEKENESLTESIDPNSWEAKLLSKLKL